MKKRRVSITLIDVICLFVGRVVMVTLATLAVLWIIGAVSDLLFTVVSYALDFCLSHPIGVSLSLIFASAGFGCILYKKQA